MTRIVDAGALVAGWVGLGMAVIIVIAFGLVVPIQPIVYAIALPAGALIGWYANQRAKRERPRGKVLANALWAGLLTGVTLAAFYVFVRLLFVFADTGNPDFNRTDPTTGQPIPPYCQTGPDCTYQRYVKAGYAADLTAVGVNDADSFGRFILAEQAGAGLALFGLVLGGAAAAGAWQAVKPVRPEFEAAT